MASGHYQIGVINLFLFSAQTEVVRSGGGGVSNQGRGQSVGDGNGRRKSQRRPAAKVAEDEAELKTRQEVGNDVILHCSANREVHLCRWKTPYLNTYIVGEGIYVERGRIQVHLPVYLGSKFPWIFCGCNFLKLGQAFLRLKWP